ncbi:EscR/YscR/HrcR family type III secretion system export apparatus protein [Pandoraea pnomenusa]|uniref:EscR/YscR/HrcR family type III secretion system export apparatus protein n=1 Tax=Pandoraea pnomenusa TaxID=93220 RepID=UPI0007BCE138|nr:EscR/YscR/HrcR family type III secretion system export apparatus protein [Pandoraea pnomenusa]ANC44854.1 EscR/YscR/HrcR family type III secretion system export apparatus protein [Pandoraea pnomenusa]
MWSDVPSIGILSLFTLLPFLVASGTCFVKFSIVFVMVRNALGLQQVPSNMTLNGVALLISLFVMLPVASAVMDAYQANPVNFGDPNSVRRFLDDGLSPYRDYLVKYADPQLTQFFAREEAGRDAGDIGAGAASPSIFALLPAYALTEIKNAFTIGFYLYLPFVVVDLVVSSVLLSLGMMMMSPVTISVPIKLILFVAMDGWSLLSQGLVRQYLP